MLLSEVTVRNFLSIKGICTFPLDPQVTVLLGANDHGKSNLLNALRHLNADSPIDKTEENWDSRGAELHFTFVLNDLEKSTLANFLVDREEAQSQRLQTSTLESDLASEEDASNDLATEGAAASAPSVALKSAVSTMPPAAAVTGNSITSLPMPIANRVGPAAVAPSATNSLADKSEAEQTLQNDLDVLRSIASDPKQLKISRISVEVARRVNGLPISDLSNEVAQTLISMIPRVEIFESFSNQLQDSVTSEEITQDSFEFVQGIFYYAGLDPLNCVDLFTQDDETDKTLEGASKRLDDELRNIWAQGVDLGLHFQLKHRGDAIELLADDPAVKARKARMSKRSAGVTQFFRLSMVLHARRQKSQANSYIYVFDEPGVFLHPKGQKDLLQVFEKLSKSTQIVYATHSLFMLNQNFPERHRLISKDEQGTQVDSKPYRANWRYAVDALGVKLTANILFSPTLLLVEGDSDPIYIYELFRVLNALGEIDADANVMGVLSYSDLPNLRFLMQTFKVGNDLCPIAVLYDGDSQGKDYSKAAQPLSKRLGIKSLGLENGCAIEDYCLFPDVFLGSVEKTLLDALESISKHPSPTLASDIKQSWQEWRQSSTKDLKDKEPSNAGRWFKEISNQVLGEEASKVALARNYAFACRALIRFPQSDAKRLQMAKSLCTQIVLNLGLPPLAARQELETSV